MAFHFEPFINASCKLVDPPPTKRTGIGGYPIVASNNMLGEQLYYFNIVVVVNGGLANTIGPKRWSQYFNVAGNVGKPGND